jgi:hypothetical protein
MMEPNEFILDGYFENGLKTDRQIRIELTTHTDIAKRINWNDYVSMEQHNGILEDAIKHES